MGELTETYPQVQNLQNQVVRKDSMATNASLRTPIQQIEVKEPKHLQVKTQFRPKKIEYKTWSREDSIYLNLIQSQDKEFFEEITIVSSPTHAVASKSSEAYLDPRLESEDSIVITEVEQTTQPAPPVKVRKSSPFQESKDWLSGFILLALIIAGFVKLSAGKYLSDLFSSIRYQQSASKLYSTFNLQNEKPGWALTVLFFLGSSLLIFEYAFLGGKSPERISPFVFFLLINVGIVLYFLLKNLLYRFVAFVFDAQQGTQEYIFNSNMLSKAFGIASLPVVCVVPFVDILTATFLLKVGLVLFLIMYFIQLLRGIKIILRTPLSIFYMFLYFCALEILPLSLLIKVMIY